MNEIGIALLWCVGQVTLLAAVTAAVYVTIRQTNPLAGIWTTTTGLAMVVLLSCLAVSPWPSWWPAGDAAQPTVAVVEAVTSAASPSAAQPEEVAGGVSQAAPVVAGPTLADAWRAFTNELSRVPAGQAARRPWWPRLIAGLFAAGAAMGLIQILGGLWAVQRIRRQSRRIEDRSLHELLDVLQAEVGSRQQVLLHESTELVTAATIGWRRPMILLPEGWRSWNEQQRRVVLAHELAHIEHRDYLAGICAQFTLALHFYHPLVHWLVRRLRLEQELAADAAAAAMAGGQRSYLVTLAEMALAQNEHPVGWAARAFLPTRRMFLRRIEMLRDMQNVSTSLTPLRRWVPVGLLVVAALAVAGLRSPRDSGSTAQAAEPETAAARSMSLEEEFQYLADDGSVVVAMRPGQIDDRSLQQLIAELWEFDTPADQIELLAFEVPGTRDDSRRRGLSGLSRMLIRTKQPHEFQQFIHGVARQQELPKSLGERRTAGGKSYFVVGDTAYFQPDDRTLVLDQPNQIAMYLRGEKARKTLQATDAWKQIADMQLAVAVSSEGVRGEMNANAPPGTSAAAFARSFAALAPLWNDTDYLFLGASYGKDSVEVKGLALASDGAKAEGVQETAQAALVLAKNMLDGLKAPQGRADPFFQVLRETGQWLLSAAKVQRDEQLVSITIDAPKEGVKPAAFLGPLTAARQAARSMQSQNNLKQIALAMHNFHDTYKRLPAAGETMEGRWKYPHSWRVALLPFLDQKALYDEYRFDEPWNSEHNLKLAQRMPDVFRHPEAPEDTTHSSYYVLTGKSTPFPPEGKTGFREIQDGTSNTIMAVEAKREIPWNKPEDIAYDESAPLPDLTGYSAELEAAFLDGSVRTLENVSDRDMRAYLTRAGREVVPQR